MGLFDTAAQKLADLEARVAALEGATEPIVYEPSATHILKTGDAVERKSFTDLTYGILGHSNSGGVAINGAAIRDCLITRCPDGIKIGSGPQSSGITIERVQVVDSAAPLFVANISDSTFTDLTLDGRPTNGYDHCVYAERGLLRCTFRNIRMTRGGGYCLHLYNGAYNGSNGSEDLLFEDCVLDARGGGARALVIYPGYKRVTLRRCKLLSDRTDQPIISMYGATDILIEDFEAEGGYSLIEVPSSGACSNVIFRNGTYPAGPPLIYGPTTGITFANVVRV